MAAQLRIPANLQLDIREVLLSLVEDALQEMSAGVIAREREYHPEWFAPARRKLTYLWSLLDCLGWGQAEDAADIEITLTGPLLALIREGIIVHLTRYEIWLAEADATDAWRVGQGFPPKKEETFRRAKDLESFLASLPV